jgi:hypothetical protein
MARMLLYLVLGGAFTLAKATTLKHWERLTLTEVTVTSISSRHQIALERVIAKTKATCGSEFGDLVVAIEEVVDKKQPATEVQRTAIVKSFVVKHGVPSSKVFAGWVSVTDLKARRSAEGQSAQIGVGSIEVEFVCTPLK